MTCPSSSRLLAPSASALGPAVPSIPSGPVMPDPTQFEVLQLHEAGKWLVVKLQYKNCTNYEGTKILVFKDMTTVQFINQKKIDPHFHQGGPYKHPFARFEPTKEGWNSAINFVTNYNINNGFR